MTPSYSERHGSRLKKILAALPKSASASLRQFVEQFFAKMPAPDLETYDPATAAALAADAYGFFAQRLPGEPSVRIFTPQQAANGWSSRHTMVELLNDDMPFLVDSLTAELMRQGFHVYDTIHPIFHVQRDKKGALTSIAGAGEAGAGKESLIHFEISSLPEDTAAAELEADLRSVLIAVRSAYQDWPVIVSKAREVLEQMDAAPKGVAPEEFSETKDFVQWLVDRSFVFLGYAEYDFYDAAGKESLHGVEGSKLGVLKVEDDTRPRGLEALPPEVHHFLRVPQMLEITKSSRKSQVHRPVHMDYIGFKRFDAQGRVVGERRFLGMFTSNVYYQSADNIPIIRRKIAEVLRRAGFDPVSHDGKALKTILEFLPRDEIFQIGVEELFEISMGILSLEARPGVRLFIRRDAFERFISCMVFVPREYFSTQLRMRISELIEKASHGAVSAFYTQIGESPLARLHLILKTTPGNIPALDVVALEAAIARISTQWSDLLKEQMLGRFGEHKTERLIRLYGNAFPESYISRYEVSQAVHDVEKMIEAQHAGGMALEFFRHGNHLHLKMYNPTDEIALSDIVPMLENMGLRAIDEHPFFIKPADESAAGVWIRDFKLSATLCADLPFEALKARFEEALAMVWRKEISNDRFNALVLRAGLSWRQVLLLRAYARYLRQTGYAFGQSVVEQSLVAHPALAAKIVALFDARFNPDADSARAGAEQKWQSAVEAELANVSDVTHDRIIRRFIDLVRATLRTNFYQQSDEGSHRPVLSFKFDSAKVPELPLPRPYAEIFVYSKRVEGIHLRGGKVARGGLRWSDRHEDFRTEVLGLMKAQMVKNSVIVPVGSKGGFVVKMPPAEGGREALQQEAVACYKLYLQGLLDLTDNIVGSAVVPPKRVIRYDGDDPYLVVAADKGTATFSDIANEISRSYHFWLDDAFASGGSAGYDHKKMAITARGGWVSVVRHFAEMGVDITKQTFTAVGIGDMSGDVFGNGMLLSSNLQLIAAFNHQHIFIDPTPDAASSFKERQRLFALPRSSWKDYDAALISRGGGVFERTAKQITLSPEAKKALGIERESLTPDELIKAILAAPVDLLWNGGIGTYVKAEEESHEQVGDRTNNAVRVNGKELRCKVVGEGGNLGFTQKGRIEYARAGGRINTDAIDNSGGVDCSDHEVNIKIAFSRALSSNTLTREKRDHVLATMTDEVARLVLKDNILQTQALTIAELQGAQLIESQQRLMQMLEQNGLLNRAIEYLPTDKAMTELRLSGKGLTRPELAVLLAYSKLALYKELVESELPDDPYFSADLVRYFPKTMHDAFDECIEQHPLRREIIATVMTNSLVNRVGMTFYSDIAQDTGLPARDIAAAYTIVRDAFGLRKLWSEIEKSGETVAAPVQAEIHARLNRFVENMTLWFLRNQPLPLSIGQVMRDFMPGIEEFLEHLEAMHSRASLKAFGKQLDYFTAKGVPEALARQIAGLEMQSSACDIITIATKAGLPVAAAGTYYFEMGTRLRIGWLRLSAARIVTGSHWERVAVQSIIQDLYEQQRRLTTLVVEMLGKDPSGGDVEEKWYQRYKLEIDRYDDFIADLKATEAPDFSVLVVALRNLKSLCSL